VNHRRVQQLVADHLLDRPGWERHPEQEFHFRHRDAGVHVMIYGSEVSVVFTPRDPGGRDRAVGASTRFFPQLSIDSALEVADALVFQRSVLAHQPNRGRSLTTSDILLLIALSDPGIGRHEAMAHLMWTCGLGGFVRPSTVTTINKAVLDLRAAGLLLPGTTERYLELTADGIRRARQLAGRFGLHPPARS
jgi:hypothetical protein